MARGRFKGFRTEATVAKMTAEEQKIYRDFVKEVENAQRNNLPLPEPPKFSTDKPEKTETTSTTGKRRGRKPGSKKINGRMVSAEEYEKIKNGIVSEVVDKAIADNKDNNGGEDEEDIEVEDDIDDADDAAMSKREQLVTEILESHTKYQEENIFAKATEDKQWYDYNEAKSDVQETVIHHCSREGFCIIETNEYFWLKRIKKMIEKCPDKVIVMPEFSSEDMLRVKVPYAAMKRVMVSTRTMTEEQRQRMSELGKSRKKKTEEVEPVEEAEETETTEDTAETTTETTTETSTKVVPETTPAAEGTTESTTEITTETTTEDTQGFTEVSEDEDDEEEEVEHVEAEIVEPTEQNHGYDEDDEEDEEGEDEFEYEPASLNTGGSTDDDEVVFERPGRHFSSGQGILQFIDTYPWGLG